MMTFRRNTDEERERRGRVESRGIMSAGRHLVGQPARRHLPKSELVGDVVVHRRPPTLNMHTSQVDALKACRRNIFRRAIATRIGSHGGSLPATGLFSCQCVGMAFPTTCATLCCALSRGSLAPRGGSHGTQLLSTIHCAPQNVHLIFICDSLTECLFNFIPYHSISLYLIINNLVKCRTAS